MEDEAEATPAQGAIEVVAATNGEAHAEAADKANAPLEATTQDADTANAALASRPRRTLRSTGRVAEEKIVKRAVRIITKRTQRKWDAERLLTDPKSPLAKANLRTILSNPMAWSSLDAADHAEILALFPDPRHILAASEDGDTPRRPDMASLRNDDSFRYDCAAYTESLAQGRHDPDWLAQAWAAHERRRAGDFDDFLRAKFESDWDVTLPPEGGESVDGMQREGGKEDAEVVVGDTETGANGLKEEEHVTA
ncbi:hypothetical protein CCM_07821 [Cordyceps militaris CM01]|uniref:DEUBAD domain-containing protein n=1 Tax=Cordyceps militaris (strain CM01) TaxID=983644 RepID=G3JNV9_CORMM|nr:uncharacterized protein CCM_07821 [Cordyceps militaris CM01]EGX89569.1 hypothetical protein CCM_07821 [Cordyceps militaris CM01]